MWISSLIVINLLQIFYAASLEVGDSCSSNDLSIEDGVCALVTNCEAAVRDIRIKRYHEFRRCGFDGSMEVVCCPKAVTKFGINEHTAIVNNERIAVRECQKIEENNLVALDLHILGGEVASIGEFPFVVALGYDRSVGYKFDCGGSVLSPTYVLSAAHCVDTLDRIKPSIVRAGVVELGSAEWNERTDVRIAQIIMSPRYVRKEKYHDLALLRLEKPLNFSNHLHPICLSTEEENPTSELTILGWGTTSNTRDIKSNMLLKAEVVAVPREKCGEFYTNWRKLPNGISPDQMCAGDPDGIRDTCQGDSGGPIVRTDTESPVLVGVTSFGRGCGSPVPGVYTRVSRYLDWIESVVWPN